MNLTEALKGVQLLFVDTSPFIYFVERNPLYRDRVRAVFERAEASDFMIVTSVVSLTETLMVPFRTMDTTLIGVYRNAFLDSRSIRTIPISVESAIRAGQLRAQYGLRTPDALQVGAALEAKCNAFLTNDRGLKRVIDLPVLILDELELAR